MKVRDVSHVSLLKKYFKDVDNVIDYSVLQVEPDGEFQQTLSVYCRKRCSCSKTEKLRKLKYNGSILGLMKLHGICQIRFKLCFLPCFLVEVKQLRYGVLVYALIWCFSL